MNKADVVDYVVGETNLSKAEAKTLIDIVFDGVVHALTEDGKVTIVNFGSFTLKEQSERVARNPRTGEKVDVPARTVLKFKPAVALKRLF